MNFIKHVRF